MANPENLEFYPGDSIPQHYQMILQIIHLTLEKNRGYFTLSQSPLARRFTLAQKALPAYESISDHEEP